MLKWAVNGSYRQSYLPDVPPITEVKNREVGVRRRSTANQRRSLTNAENRKIHRRKSCGNELSVHFRLNRENKENNLTSTPLSLPMRVTYGSRKKLSSLRDLSNISQEKIPTTPENDSSLGELQKSKTASMQYASTLPTFDVEYSPCSVVPGPLLALRGVGIADSYFEKPRYLTNEFRELNQLIEATPSSKTMVTDNNVRNNCDYEESLSSSKMGDTTLERMIDAILESARKERKIPKPQIKAKQTLCPIMSPTYTPAEDPASDLHEFWDPQSEKYLQSEHKFDKGNLNETKVIVNEREVRTPEYFRKMTEDILASQSKTLNNRELSCQLKRQKAVRRKRKLALSSAAFLKSSAQKIFPSNSLIRKSLDHLVERRPPPHSPNISPDSGRNSCSDLEDSTEDITVFTKRRLSFSSNEEKEI